MFTRCIYYEPLWYITVTRAHVTDGFLDDIISVNDSHKLLKQYLLEYIYGKPTQLTQQARRKWEQ